MSVAGEPAAMYRPAMEHDRRTDTTPDAVGVQHARRTGGAPRLVMSDEPTEWWIRGVPIVALLHLALFLALRSRPGAAAIVLWRWGPPLLVVASAVLLGAALWTSFRRRHTWSVRRVAGLGGLCALVAAVSAYRTYPSSHDGRPSRLEFRLPLSGPLRVAWGGATPAVNYHVAAPAERWGYDLLVTVDGVSHEAGATAPDDYYAYGRAVHAPAAGHVIDVHDGDPDARPGQPDPRRGAGNRIVMEVAPGEFLVVAHLKSGTIRVRPGDRVEAGDLLAQVGNSGNSSEPHVHLHLQDTPVPGEGEAIPFYFSDYVHQDGTAIRRGMPIGGVRDGRYVGDHIRAMP